MSIHDGGGTTNNIGRKYCRVSEIRINKYKSTGCPSMTVNDGIANNIGRIYCRVSEMIDNIMINF